MLLFVSLIELLGRRKALVIMALGGGVVLPFSLIPGLDRYVILIVPYNTVQRNFVSVLSKYM